MKILALILTMALCINVSFAESKREVLENEHENLNFMKAYVQAKAASKLIKDELDRCHSEDGQSCDQILIEFMEAHIEIMKTVDETLLVFVFKDYLEQMLETETPKALSYLQTQTRFERFEIIFDFYKQYDSFLKDSNQTNFENFPDII